MSRSIVKTATFGDLVVAVFDEAARHSPDSRVVSRLATRTVMRMLRRLAGRPTLRRCAA